MVGKNPRLLSPTLSIRFQASRYTLTELSFQLPSLILDQSLHVHHECLSRVFIQAVYLNETAI